jgi:hypothetical protein
MLSVGYAQCHLQALHDQRRYTECRSAQKHASDKHYSFFYPHVFACLLAYFNLLPRYASAGEPTRTQYYLFTFNNFSPETQQLPGMGLPCK